jgi:hypothetical protein
MKNLIIISLFLALSVQGQSQVIIDHNVFADYTTICTSIYTVSAKSGVSLRSEPSTSGQRLAKIPHGKKVTLCEVYSEVVETIEGKESSWMRVDFQGKKGYVFGAFLEPSTDYRLIVPGYTWEFKASEEIYTALYKNDEGYYTKSIVVSTPDGTSFGQDIDSLVALVKGIQAFGKVTPKLVNAPLWRLGDKYELSNARDFAYLAGDIKPLRGDMIVENIRIGVASPPMHPWDEGKDYVLFQFPLESMSMESLSAEIIWLGDLDLDGVDDLILRYTEAENNNFFVVLSTEAELDNERKLVVYAQAIID